MNYAIFICNHSDGDDILPNLALTQLCQPEDLDVTFVGFHKVKDIQQKNVSRLNLFGTFICWQFHAPYTVFLKLPTRIDSDSVFTAAGKYYVGCFSVFPEKEDLIQRIMILRQIRAISTFPDIFSISGTELRSSHPNAMLSKQDEKELNKLCKERNKPILNWIKSKQANLIKQLNSMPKLWRRSF